MQVSYADVPVNVIGCIQSALKAKCPIVGIPMPGRKPFNVRRERLAGALRGMSVIDAAIQLPLQEHDPTYLVVYGKAPRTKGTYKFLALSHWDAWRLTHDWAESQRKARKRPAVPVGKYAKAVARLERDLAKLGNVEPPECALLGESWYDAKWLHERGSQWVTWKREAGLRRKLWHMANAEGVNTASIYRQARELAGVRVHTWSELGKRDKDSCHGNLHEYLQRFHEFCGLTPKPYGFEPHEWNDSEGYADFGPKHYAGWIERLRARNGILSEIEGVRLLAGEVGACGHE